MKKIKSVKLKQDIKTPESFIPKGTIGKLTKYADYLGGELCKFTNGITDVICQYKLRDMQYMPDWFDITYQEDFFEVGDEKTEYIILGDGTIYDFINNNTCHYIQGNAGTKAEMEYKRMHNETMHYFRKLAEELNGDWQYEAGGTYKELFVNNNKDFQLIGCSNTYPCIKFSRKVTIDQITSRAKPEMLENYKKICQNPY
jgi:hypothetical protein